METLSRKLRKRRKVNVDLEIENSREDNLPWQSRYQIGYVRFSLYRDDAVLHIKVVSKEKKKEPVQEGFFNSYQYFLFRRAIFGLEVYDKDALEYMHREKRARIEKVNRRAKETIERFLQQVMIHVTDRLFVILFPGAYVTTQLLAHHNAPVGNYDIVTKRHDKLIVEQVEDFILKLAPRDFKISNKTIAGLLVIHHVLPDNFFQLGVKDDPRARRLSQKITEPIDTL